MKRDDLVSDPLHKVTVRVRPGQVLRRQGFSATCGMRVRVSNAEATWLERRGIAERV